MIKILQIARPDQKDTGIAYYRQAVPHTYLLNASQDFDVAQYSSIKSISDEDLKEYQIVQFLRIIDDAEEVVKRCHALGVKVVFDVDDYWHLPKDHQLYEPYKKHDYTNKIIESIKLADHVTVTTAKLADQVKPINANVTVIPNAIDTNQPQYKIRKIDHPRLRFGWIGAAFHHKDIELLANSMVALHKDRSIIDQWQLCLAGYKHHDYPIYLENIFTNRYKALRHSPEYLLFLAQYKDIAEHMSYDTCYRRIWSRPAHEYVKAYNEIDVAIAPLVSNQFNSCKSELKVLEAGFMKKAIICSDVEPYNTIVKNGVNGQTVKPGRDYIDWFCHIRRYVLNRNMVEDHAEALYESVQPFAIERVNKIREDLYKSLCR